jgi:hypothetical protein
MFCDFLVDLVCLVTPWRSALSSDLLRDLFCLVTLWEVWSVWCLPVWSDKSGHSLGGLVFLETHLEVVSVL